MRSAFDKLISWTGLALVAVLLAAGGLLTWANMFIGDQVHDQLVMQGITMPGGEALADLPKADQDALKEYAGSALDTGPEAKAYSDHYILVHMNAASDGRTYEEVSGEFVQLSDEDKASADGQAAGSAAPDAVHGQHPARAAPLRLRLRHDRHDRRDRRHRRLRRRCPAPGARHARVPARSPCRAHGREHRSGACLSTPEQENTASRVPVGTREVPARQFGGADSTGRCSRARSWYRPHVARPGVLRRQLEAPPLLRDHSRQLVDREHPARGRVMSQWLPGPSNPFVADATTRA